MSQVNWQDNLAQLPLNAIEPKIETSFVIPLLQSLGYSDKNQTQQFPTGNGKVDFAARKESNNFIENPQNPDLLVEVKGRRTSSGSIINLASGTSQYRETVNQLNRYLLAPNCKSAKWGIITNGNHLQLFRKHGKVIHPATPNLEINSQSITRIIQRVKTIIETPQRGLTVTFYNNQGGVGKTTTLVNLAGLLSQGLTRKKKVLAIDFDSQGDLSRLLGINQAQNLSMPLLQNQQPELTLYQCLTNTNAHLKQAVERIPIYIPRQKQTIVTDYLWAVAVKEDEKENLQNINISQIQGQASRLKKLIQSVKNDYDYIFIDAPPSSDFFSKSALFAADVVLIPTEHIHVNSLYNAKYLIKNTLPRIQEEKQEGTPVPLPIFFNDHKPTSPSFRNSHRIIQGLLRQENNAYDPDLVPYFYPRSTKILDPYVFSIKSHLNIPAAAVEKRIASLKYRPIAELYLSMAKEYFLDG